MDANVSIRQSINAHLQQHRQPLISSQDFSFLSEIKTKKRKAKPVWVQLLQTQGQKTLQNMLFNKLDIYI